MTISQKQQSKSLSCSALVYGVRVFGLLCSVEDHNHHASDIGKNYIFIPFKQSLSNIYQGGLLFCESDLISARTSHKVSWGLKTSLIPIKDPWQHFMASHGTGPMSHFPLFSKISKLIEYSHVTPLQKRNFMLITIKKLWLLKNFILRSYSKIDVLDFLSIQLRCCKN